MFYNLIKIQLLFLSIGALFFTSSTAVHAQNKDSSYYLQDDGIFSDEEKDQEAEIIKRNCEIDTMQGQYYNCACIAGAFRQKRDEPLLMPQAHIIYDLFQDTTSECVDPVKIAGNIYNMCQNYAKSFRSRANNNDEFCKCAANKASKNFTLNPKLQMRHIEKIRRDAMVSCQRELGNFS